MAFETYSKRSQKRLVTIHNAKLLCFCIAMTIAQIEYMIDLDSNPLFIEFKFMYFWGHIHYPGILFIILCLMHGFFIKIGAIFFTQSVLITFLVISENELAYYKIGYLMIISFCSLLCSFVFVYVEEIHFKEKYLYYMNFKKNIFDWQNIVNNVPYGIALFQKSRPHTNIFSNSYGNDILDINISCPNLSSLETLSKNLGVLKKIRISAEEEKKNDENIASELNILSKSVNSKKQMELLIPEKTYLIDFFTLLENNPQIDSETNSFIYLTCEKIKFKKDERNFLVKVKSINFENQKALLLILEDNSQNDLIATLKSNNEYKSKLLCSFSHELKTPLNGALPLLREIKNDQIFKINHPDKYDHLQIAINSLVILQSVLNDIVDYAQINTGQLQLNCTDINLKKTILDVLDIISLQLKEKRLTLITEFDEDIPPVFNTDKNRISQILLNILRNSIKFSNGPGKIVLTVTKNLSNSLKNELINIKIRDSGVGIKKSHLLFLKEVLAKIKNSMNETITSEYSEMGNLGLKISQNLALILGPSNEFNGLNIFSKENNGTTVDFLIEDKSGLTMAEGEMPCISMIRSKKISNGTIIRKISSLKLKKRPSLGKQSFLWLNSPDLNHNDTSVISERVHAEAIKIFPITENYTLEKIEKLENLEEVLNLEKEEKNKKIETAKPCCEPLILIVDDDPFNLLSVEVILKKIGYKCIKAFNGKEAIEIVEKFYIDKKCDNKCLGINLIFMDYNMPVMNGIESTKKLKEKMNERKIPEIPIVACSAFGAKDDIENCFEAGMVDYLSKPLTIESTKNMVGKWIK